MHSSLTSVRPALHPGFSSPDELWKEILKHIRYTLGMPGFGYGIDYEYGMFTQEIQDGYQREKPDRWKKFGTPLQIPRPDQSVHVPIYGRCDAHARASQWTDQKLVVGIPSDLPVAGYGGRTINYLRL